MVSGYQTPHRLSSGGLRDSYPAGGAGFHGVDPKRSGNQLGPRSTASSPTSQPSLLRLIPISRSGSEIPALLAAVVSRYSNFQLVVFFDATFQQGGVGSLLLTVEAR